MKGKIEDYQEKVISELCEDRGTREIFQRYILGGFDEENETEDSKGDYKELEIYSGDEGTYGWRRKINIKTRLKGGKRNPKFYFIFFNFNFLKNSSIT